MRPTRNEETLAVPQKTQSDASNLLDLSKHGFNDLLCFAWVKRALMVRSFLAILSLGVAFLGMRPREGLGTGSVCLCFWAAM